MLERDWPRFAAASSRFNLRQGKIGAQIDVERSASLGGDFLAQRGAQRIDDAAFDAISGHDGLAPHGAPRESERDTLKRMTRERGTERRAPVYNQPAIGGRERRYGDAAPLQNFRPGAVGPEARPACAAERQDRGAGLDADILAAGAKEQTAIFVPAAPFVTRAQLRALRRQSREQGAQ